MRIYIAVLLAALVLPAQAQEAVKPTPELEKAMSRFNGALKVEAWFRGPGNLTGVAARFNGQPMVFFTDPEGRYMLTGAAVEMNSGKNLIAEATTKYFANFGIAAKALSPLPSPEKSSIDKAKLTRFTAIHQGSGKSGKVAYVIFDFGCEYCMSLYHAISKESLTGEIRWVPVALSGDVAATKAALAIGFGKMDAALALEGKQLKDVVLESKEALGRGALAVENNTVLSKDMNIGTTPYFIYEVKENLFVHSGYATADKILEALGVR